MNRKLTLIVALYINPGREAEFEKFESAASAIMLRHGGRLERRIGCADEAGDDNPHEIHIISFPDLEALDRYRHDEELRGMAALRASAIKAMTVWMGKDIPPF